MDDLPRAPAPPRPGFSPRNWGGWLVVGIYWFLGHLPRPVGRALVAPLGPLLYRLMSSRRRIAERNIALCLPELNADERERMVKACFGSLARMLPEMAWCWAGPAQDMASICRISEPAKQHVQAALAEDRGVLVVTAHVTCLEVGARALGELFPGHGVYRPLNNEVIEWYQNRGRAWYASSMISKRDIRSLVRVLRAGGFAWYAADQDFGPQQSVFAPFFGVEAATLLATHRLPRLTGCRVLAMLPRYLPDEGIYEIDVSPVFEDFPSDDPVADLARVNAVLEAQVRKAPEQYWWIHRRFKTRPGGQPDIYGDDARES
ncbi:LpxL/LpxP family acyltransferase [Marinihelvus fidelis]|nr:lipid A biosynthesis lauroyl acyltransferase [Marinihelvus fidelis]